MKFLVYDIAALSGGAVTILDTYYQLALNDKSNQWYFIVSLDRYVSADNVKIIYEKQLDCQGMRRWKNRLVFENSKLGKIIQEITPDEAISLQNMPVPACSCPQTVYLHQPLQFSPVRYSFFRKEERPYAFRQTVICNIMRHRLKSANHIMVQTNWMKDAVCKWVPYPAEKVTVEWPQIDCPPPERIYEMKRGNFFYPASSSLHKNHMVIIKACEILKKRGITDFHVDFTLQADEDTYTKKISKVIKEKRLPISLIGYLSKEDVYMRYRSSVLLFPSYLETFGLPLLEARRQNGTILASNLPFSQEILEGYGRASLIAWDSAEQWATAMEIVITMGNGRSDTQKQ